MARLPRTILLLLALALGGPLLLLPTSDATQAAEPEHKPPRTRKGQVVRKWAYDRLSSAYELIEEEKFDEALRKLRKMEKSSRINDYERALVFQAFGYVHGARESYTEALEYLERCLALSVLEPASELSVRYNMGQLYLATGRIDEGIRTLEAWFTLVESPAPEAYMALANAYIQKEDFAHALPLARTAVERSQAPKESWLKLLLSLLLDSRSYTEAADVLQTLVTHFPKKVYWIQLSAVLGELEREEESLAAYEMAYKQELLTESRELVHLAELYLYHEIPYKAARLLEEGLDRGLIGSSARVWELLANSWLSAQERERALPALKRAAELSEDGSLSLRLAQVLADRERWDDAERAAASALEKGSLQRPGSAHLLRGISRLRRGRRDLARRSFERARQDDRTRKSAEQWLRYLRSTSPAD